ncbi:hypothetical protein NBRC110019_20940 [Neptunitalea chrysea]|uniref:Uncharacterized protein n=1 Tax=Neptunitalea chrysea TaxID=1647581 RepID=A0A9W6B837_9FLAO|nr:hypothetical protein [Neptunitalea chrysea]GLB53054.1 hypothetical protein NBRC110019_20940 [Neptunitalea chrysea]
MAVCDAKLSGKFVRQCGHKPKQGIVKKWYFNWEDIDRVATTTSNSGTKVEALVLKTGTYLYPAEGNNKTSSANHALSVLDFGNGYVHTDSFTVMYRGDEESERIQELVNGGRVCTLIQTVDSGVSGELSYHVLGLESGMLVTEDTWNASENSGTTTLTVATQEGEEESTGKKIFMMTAATQSTDLEETEAWITANEVV